jgi:trigger factor
MKIELTDQSPVKKSLTVELDEEMVAKETESVLKSYAAKAQIPGFRPGKAPKSVIQSRFAKEIKEDVRERLVSRSFHEAAKEHDLKPLGNPSLEEISDDPGSPLRYKTSFEVLPEIDLKGHEGIDVRRPSVVVSDADVDKTLDELRESQAKLVTEEGRKAITGDVLVADVEGRPEEGEAFNREAMMIEVGSTDNMPGFNEKLEGAEAGQELEFSIDFPKEHPIESQAGKAVAYKIKVHEVKRRVLPELDDEFAKDLGEFDDLDALKSRIREDLEARKKRDSEMAVRQGVLDKLLLENPIVLPEILVEEEIRQRLEEMVRRMMMQGMDPEQMNLDWKDLRQKQDEPARKSVHARLLLDALAEMEKLEITKDEIDDRLKRDAEAMGENHDKFRAQLEKRGGLEVLKNQMIREKSLDLVTSLANIQDEE